jgi:hypothetical protein
LESPMRLRTNIEPIRGMLLSRFPQEKDADEIARKFFC